MGHFSVVECKKEYDDMTNNCSLCAYFEFCSALKACLFVPIDHHFHLFLIFRAFVTAKKI